MTVAKAKYKQYTGECFCFYIPVWCTINGIIDDSCFCIVFIKHLLLAVSEIRATFQ